MEDELIVRYLSGEASDEEKKKLLAWTAQSPENEKQFLSAEKLFELSDRHYATRKPHSLDINVEQEWNHFVNSIEKKKETPVRAIVVAKPSFAGNWLRIAASVALILVSSAIVYFFVRDNDVHYQTTNNTLTVSLPDGSSVVLNEYSELSYSTSFGENNRQVKLKGQGFFNVEKDKQKPFIIDATQTKVEVVGTSFDVRAYEDTEAVEVVVQTGVVKFSAPVAKGEITIAAGQKGIYSKAKQHLDSFVNEDPNFNAWNTRTIVFAEDNLRTVIETLNKTYHANIIATGEISASCVVTVTFDHQTLEAVLNVLKTTLNLTYRINGNQIEITRAGC
jgi:transmembrane sensor